MNRRKITRRQFLSVSASVSAGLVAAACGGEDATSTPLPEPTEAAAPTEAPKAEPTATTAAAEPTTPPEPVSMYQEAPMLAELVAAGELPPVDERLPKNPWVAPMRAGAKFAAAASAEHAICSTSRRP